MPLDPEDPTVRTAVFGRQVEDFLNGDIGAFLLKRAQADITEGLDELRDVDPEDPKAVRAAQNKVRVAQSIINWLGDVVQQGHQAMAVLNGETDG